MTNKLRFGIMSAAGIAHKVVAIMNDSQFATPVAVASRDLSKAKEFAAKFNIPRAYGSYDELLADSEVDAVYIPIPTGLRFEWVIKAARAKKHILCEKPLLSAQEAKDIVRECQQNDVHFMDNTMWLHHDRTKIIEKDYINNGFLLNRVHNNFSFRTTSSNIRFNTKLEPLGALGDLGWYCLGNILWAFNFELPISVWGKGHYDTETGAMTDCTAVISFSRSRTASFDCSFRDVTRQNFELVGPNEYIRAEGFIIPFENEPHIWKRDSYEPKAKFTITNLTGDSKVIETKPCDQVLNLFEQFAKDSATPQSRIQARHWGEKTIKVMTVLDAVLESVNQDAKTVFLKTETTNKVLMVGQ